LFDLKRAIVLVVWFSERILYLFGL